jgi:hypothetical protein
VAEPESHPRPAAPLRTLAGLVLLAAGTAWLATADAVTAALWLVGAGLGIALFHATFSFAAGFRRFLADGRGADIRAQLLLIGLCAAAFLPLIALGTPFGQPVRGFVFPTGLALLLGAFLFGIGMQLGGGCGSGTLFSAGASGGRMWLTLACFVAGATLAAWQAELWLDWRSLPPIALAQWTGGHGSALVLTLAALGLAWFGVRTLELRRHGTIEARRIGRPSLWRGPWPLLWGALALAALNVATLLLAGRPWAITAAFPLWGSRVVEWAGWDDPAFWAYWEDPTRTEALFRPLWTDRVGVMDVGLMAGAFLAAGLAGRRLASLRLRAGDAVASVAGGLLLGVGAVLASGCNISAFVGGIASGSLHGWVWIAPALLGNWIGVRLRPAFGLATPAAAGTMASPVTTLR